MFRKSFFLALGVLTVVFISAFVGQMLVTRQLPSAYDPGLGIDEAFRTSPYPLLIEFYSDTCSSCRTVTPLIHDVYQRKYKGRLTLVLLNIDDPDVFPVSQIFGVREIPAVYVFDFKRMKKRDVALEELYSEPRLTRALDEALSGLSRLPVKTTGQPRS